MALYYKRLSGAEVAKIFETYGVYGYITKYFESLHTWETVILCRILMIISVGWLCRSELIQTQDSTIWRKKGYGRDRKQ